MDPNSNYRLASMEHEQRAQSAPIVPEYDTPNVEIQPGWALRLLLSLVSRLGHFSQPLVERKESVRKTQPCAPVVEQHG